MANLYFLVHFLRLGSTSQDQRLLAKRNEIAQLAFSAITRQAAHKGNFLSIFLRAAEFREGWL